MNRREKIICSIALAIGLMIGCLAGLIYQQERMINGAVELGESITGNNIIIDINETVFAKELMELAKEYQNQMIV